MTAYAELQTTSNFSFLRGGSHPEELVERAAELELAAIGIADRNTLAGVVRAHVAARHAGIRVLVGARLDLADGPPLLCYPRDRAAYGRLCRLLTLGQGRAVKGSCLLRLRDVLDHAGEQVLIAIPPAVLPDRDFAAAVTRLRREAAGSLHIAASMPYRGNDRARLNRLRNFAVRTGLPVVATNDVHYHVPGRRPLQDVLTAIREHVTVPEAGYLLAANAERHLKAADEMVRLFRGHEDAVRNSVEIAGQCAFSLDELAYDYPDEPIPDGMTAQQYLERLTWEGAAWRFPEGVPDKVRQNLKRELELIGQLEYAPYFLTVHDIVRFARERGILCQGRGSAANSAVCYCLAITSVNPAEIDLLFERFVSAARKEPPDIDIDFEHERREEVIQYLYRRYGRDRAALAATVITYRSRSAVREVGKAMGLSEDTTAALAGTAWGGHGDGFPERRVREAGLDPDDPLLCRTIALANELVGFPRHLSQHVGGFVLTRSLLSEIVPIGNAAMPDRTFVEWDKDDLHALGLMKVDILALGMLTCLRKAFDLLRACKGIDHDLATVPSEDPEVYDMLCRADSIGVFQIESRAQMNMLARLKPRSFYDLVIEIAIVRPGPIQGDMVHPYLRRRDGLEEVVYPEPDERYGDRNELRNVLEKTLGVPLFQEQAMQIAITAARFTADEANALRHSMATFRKRGTLPLLKDKMVGGMIGRGYDPELAKRCFSQIEGFGEYGFPESHSASFALLAYASSWLKCHHPEIFACALLNSQPMGFYAPAQIVRDAREHGVEIRPPDINMSLWDSSLEPCDGRYLALRLGLRQIDGASESDLSPVIDARGRGYRNLEEMRRRSGIPVRAIERLANADAFGSMGLDRRQALWQARALENAAPLPLFDTADHCESDGEPEVALPAMPLSEHVVSDYRTLRLSLRAHPVSFLRERLAGLKVLSAREIRQANDGTRAIAAGIVLARQRPVSASGVVFMTLEDETGIVNAIIWPGVMERFRKTVLGSRLILIEGRIQRADTIVHLIAGRLKDLTPWLDLLSEEDAAASAKTPRRGAPHRHPRNLRVIPKSRDFR